MAMYFLSEEGIRRTAKANKLTLGRMPSVPQMKLRRLPSVTSSDSSGGTGGSSGCCCNTAWCVDLCDVLEDDVVTTCGSCPNGTLKQMIAQVGRWAAFPNLSDPDIDPTYGHPTYTTFIHDGGTTCTWSSPSLTQDGGIYKWVANTADKTVKLTHISGADPALITDGFHEVLFAFDGDDEDFECLCQMPFKLKHPNRVRKPQGLNGKLCLKPVTSASIPECPEVEGIIPCIPTVTFPSISFTYSQSNPQHWATDTGEVGGTPMLFPYGFTGSTTEVVELEPALSESCYWAGSKRTVAAVDPVSSNGILIGGHGGVTFSISVNYTSGEVGVSFYSYQGQVDATYYLDPASWVIGDNVVPLTYQSGTDVATIASTMTITLTDCYFATSYPDVGYGCYGAAARGCDWYVSGNTEPYSWTVVDAMYEACPSGCPAPPMDPTFNATYHTDCY